MKRLLTVQDISCVGRCSLTVALPVISAMGVETAVLPTAVLSAHTKFQNCTFRDLTEDLLPIIRHWQREDIRFDGIYTGYLGSQAQIHAMEQLFAAFPDSRIIVDPVMGDNGKLYKGFDRDFAESMARLCAQADILLPNITEACLLTGTPYRERYDEGFIDELLCKLSDLGAKVSVLTGVSREPGQTGVAGKDTATGEVFWYSHSRLPESYHGTGDLFSAAFAGGIMLGKTWQEAAALAADFTEECIRLTIQAPGDSRFGVRFEQAIPYLLTLT